MEESSKENKIESNDKNGGGGGGRTGITSGRGWNREEDEADST